MSDVEFDGRPFIAGSMVGVRSFRVDRLGRLTAVMKESVFRPGENVAECHPSVRLTWSYSIVLAGPGEEPEPETPKTHRVASLGCSCGFYAYYDTGSNPYRERTDTIEAIVEGYGTVTTGSRGFRAEKARLLGLILPDRKRSGWLFDGLARAWARTDVYGLAFGGLLAPAGIVAGIAAEAYHLAVYVYALLFLAVPLGVGLSFLSIRGSDLNEGLIDDGRADSARVRELFDLVRRNYPDVPVYPSRAAALRAHPLTVPEPPTPESDPEFWTRAS